MENPHASAFTLEAPCLHTGNMKYAILCCILGQGSFLWRYALYYLYLLITCIMFGQKVKLVKFDWEEEKTFLLILGEIWTN